MTYRRLTTTALIVTLFNAFFASQLSSASSLDDLLNNGASGSSSISSNANTLSTLKDLEQEFSLDDVATDEVFLRVEEAYKLTVSKLSDNNGLELSWLIADKYYLYGEQFKVSINNQAIAVNLPTGIIEYDQIFEKDVEKHYRQAKISIDQDQLPNHPGYELTV